MEVIRYGQTCLIRKNLTYKIAKTKRSNVTNLSFVCIKRMSTADVLLKHNSNIQYIIHIFTGCLPVTGLYETQFGLIWNHQLYIFCFFLLTKLKLDALFTKDFFSQPQLFFLSQYWIAIFNSSANNFSRFSFTGSV